MKKLILALIITVCIMLVPAAAFAAEEITAYIYPNGDAQGISIVQPAVRVGSNTYTETIPAVGTYNGKQAWKLYRTTLSSTTRGQTLYFDLFRTFVGDVNDGSTFEFEIEYSSKSGILGSWEELSKDSNAAFELRYDSTDTSTYRGSVFGTDRFGGWKTARLKVDDASFDGNMNRLDLWYAGQNIEADFSVSTHLANRWYNADLNTVPLTEVYIASVKVIKRTAENPVTAKLNIEEAGNTFEWYKAEKPVSVQLLNTLNTGVDAILKCEAQDQYGYKVLDFSQDITLGAKEQKNISVNVDTERCGKYVFKTSIVYGDGSVSTFNDKEFAIVKTDPNGIRDEKSFISTNLGETGDEVADAASIEMIKKSNAAGPRIGVSMSYFTEWNNGTPRYFDNYTYPTAFKKIVEADLDVLLTTNLFASGIPTLGTEFEALSTPEHSAEAQTAITGLFEYFNSKLGDNIKYYEIWNEACISANPSGGTIAKTMPVAFGQAYADICRMAATASATHTPNAKLIGFIWPENEEWATASEESLKKNIADYVDFYTQHPYSNNQDYETGIDNRIALRDAAAELMKQYSDKPYIPIACEAGTMSANYNLGGLYEDIHTFRNEYEQGNHNIRGYLMNIYAGAEAWTTYLLAEISGDTRNAGDSLGITSSQSRRIPTPNGDTLIPKEAFIQETAKNYWLANSEYRELQVSDDNYVMTFDSNKFADNSVSVIWTTGEPREISLDLGVRKITYSDGYGNEKEMTSKDGVYSIYATERPVYVIGGYETVLLSQAETNGEFMVNVSGRIASEAYNTPVSLVVLPESVEYSAANIINALYIGECTTTANGGFEFTNIAVSSDEGKLVGYIKAFGSKVQRFEIGKNAKNLNMYVYIEKDLQYPSPDYVPSNMAYTDKYKEVDVIVTLRNVKDAEVVVDFGEEILFDTPLMYYAFYKGDVLKSVTVTEPYGGSDGIYTYTPAEPEGVEYDAIKVFLLDKTTIRPLTEKIVIPQN